VAFTHTHNGGEQVSTATTTTQAAKLAGYGVRLFGSDAFDGVDSDNAYEVLDRLKVCGDRPDCERSKAAAVDMLIRAFWGHAVLRHPNGDPIGSANLEQAYRSGMAYPEGWIRVNKRPAYVD
jgi:hypothetical protein